MSAIEHDEHHFDGGAKSSHDIAVLSCWRVVLLCALLSQIE